MVAIQVNNAYQVNGNAINGCKDSPKTDEPFSFTEMLKKVELKCKRKTQEQKAVTVISESQTEHEEGSGGELSGTYGFMQFFTIAPEIPLKQQTDDDIQAFMSLQTEGETPVQAMQDQQKPIRMEEMVWMHLPVSDEMSHLPGEAVTKELNASVLKVLHQMQTSGKKEYYVSGSKTDTMILPDSAPGLVSAEFVAEEYNSLNDFQQMKNKTMRLVQAVNFLDSGTQDEQRAEVSEVKNNPVSVEASKFVSDFKNAVYLKGTASESGLSSTATGLSISYEQKVQLKQGEFNLISDKSYSSSHEESENLPTGLKQSVEPVFVEAQQGSGLFSTAARLTTGYEQQVQLGQGEVNLISDKSYSSSHEESENLPTGLKQSVEPVFVEAQQGSAFESLFAQNKGEYVLEHSHNERSDNLFRSIFTQAINAQEFVSHVSGSPEFSRAKAEVIMQVAERVTVMSGEGITEMQVQIHPENLGKLLLRVVNENGLYSAHIKAETFQVKELIQSHLNDLKSALKEQGYNFFSLDVSLSNNQSDNRQWFWGERYSLNRNGSSKVNAVVAERMTERVQKALGRTKISGHIDCLV